MPKEVKDREEFMRLSERASECRIKRLKDVVKLKLRTKGYLYTLKLSVAEAEDVIKRLRCPVREF